MIVSSYHYLLGPVVAVAALGLIVLMCRWVFSTDAREDRTARRREKLVALGADVRREAAPDEPWLR